MKESEEKICKLLDILIERTQNKQIKWNRKHVIGTRYRYKYGEIEILAFDSYYFDISSRTIFKINYSKPHEWLKYIKLAQKFAQLIRFLEGDSVIQKHIEEIVEETTKILLIEKLAGI